MLRTVLAIVAGLITAMLVIFGVEAAGMLLFPPPAGMPLETEADLAKLVAMASPAAKAWLVFGWALGSFVGAWVAARISRRHRRIAALAVALFIVAGTVMNAMVITHPLWMNLLGILLPVPLALLAARLTESRKAPAQA
jgi:MFS family permease